jgi:hypothetical protein
VGGEFLRYAAGVVGRDHRHDPAGQQDDERLALARPPLVEIEPVDAVAASVRLDPPPAQVVQADPAHLSDLVVRDAFAPAEDVVVTDDEIMIRAGHPAVVIGHLAARAASGLRSGPR